MTSVINPYGPDWASLSDEQQLVALSDRKLGKRQAELGVYLMAELNKDAAEIITILDAIREFNAAKRGAGTEGSEKRVPVAEQIIVSLEALLDEDSLVDKHEVDYEHGVKDAISVAGRYV